MVAQVVEADTAGDPCGPSKWVRQSLGHIKATLAGIGVAISHMSIRRLLKQQDYSLKANRKSVSLTQHPERDRQFRYLDRVKKMFLDAGHPVISVDTKKKELIGNYKNAGATWKLAAEAVNDHDFPSQTTIRAVPYGIYDIAHNQGYVYVE